MKGGSRSESAITIPENSEEAVRRTPTQSVMGMQTQVGPGEGGRTGSALRKSRQLESTAIRTRPMASPGAAINTLAVEGSLYDA